MPYGYFDRPPHEMLKIRDVLSDSEPFAVVVGEFFYGAVPELTPCGEGEEEGGGLLFKRQGDVGIEDEGLEGCV